MTGSSDADALTGGFRARTVLLAVVLVGGVGAAVWSGTRVQGEGQAESRQRLMVVAGDEAVDYHAVLERAGFEIAVDGYAGWVETARAALPDSEAEGVALLLEHADREGIGYLVLAQPGEHALDELDLDIEPAPRSIDDLAARDYAVLSVGDLAFPHHLSADAPGDHPLIRVPGFAALEAVFAQPSLLAREDPERPTVEELQHEHALEPGQRMVERPASFELAIAEADDEVAARLAADVGVERLTPVHSAGSAVPLQNGGVLVVHHPIEIYSHDASRLELHPGATMRFDYLDREALAARLAGEALALAPCESLAGGRLALDDQPRLEAARDGSALTITIPGEGTELWQLAPGPGCQWSRLGAVDGRGEGHLSVAPVELPAGLARPDQPDGRSSLALAEIGVDVDGYRTIRAWTRGARASAGPGLGSGEAIDAGADLARVDLLRLEQGRLGPAVFVDRDHLALLSSVPLPAELATTTRMREDAILILERRAPGAHLRVPTLFFAEDMALRELAVLAPPRVDDEGRVHGPRLVVVAARIGGPTELLTVEIAGEAWAEFDRLAPAERAVEAGLEPRLYTLTPDDLDIDRLEPGRASQRFGLTVRDGVLVWAEIADGQPSELARLRLDVEGSPQIAQLTHNTVADSLPRAGPHGELVVFSTLIRTSLSTTAYSIPRVLALD